MAVKKGLGKGLDSLIADKVSTKQMAKTETPTKLKSEHAADAVMMEIAKVEPNRDQPRQKFELVQNVKKIKEEIDTIIKELENI